MATTPEIAPGIRAGTAQQAYPFRGFWVLDPSPELVINHVRQDQEVEHAADADDPLQLHEAGALAHHVERTKVQGVERWEDRPYRDECEATCRARPRPHRRTNPTGMHASQRWPRVTG